MIYLIAFTIYLYGVLIAPIWFWKPKITPVELASAVFFWPIWAARGLWRRPSLFFVPFVFVRDLFFQVIKDLR